MADHFAQQIIDAVVTALTGLTTTGSNITQGKQWPFNDGQVTALTVSMGENIPLDTQSFAIYTARLEVIVTAHAKTTGSQADSLLNQISKEVFIALMTDRTRGLSFVIDTEWAGNDQPDIDVSTEAIAAQQDLRFFITFRHSLTDPSQ